MSSTGYKRRLSAKAEADLLGIFEYSFEIWGERQMRKYRGQILDALDAITANPFRVLSRRYAALSLGIRLFPAGKHYIFYRVTGETVVILRILGQSMDLIRHVKEAMKEAASPAEVHLGTKDPKEVQVTKLKRSKKGKP